MCTMSQCRRVLLAALLVAFPDVGAAQTVEQLRPDARVRVWAPDSGLARRIMKFVGRDRTLLTVRPLDSTVPVSIRWDAVQRLQAASGMGGLNPIKGALIGASVGTVAGMMIAIPFAESDSWVAEGHVASGAAIGFAAGGMLGFILGAAFAERWSDVDLVGSSAIDPDIRVYLAGRRLEIRGHFGGG